MYTSCVPYAYTKHGNYYLIKVQMPTTDLTVEQEKEVLESLRKKGYKALKGEERELYKTLNAKYPLGEKEEKRDDEADEEVEPEEVATKEDEKVENPFAKNPKKSAPVVGGNVEQKASYKFKDNVLSGDDYFKKDQVISGSNPHAQRFFREGLICKV